MPAGALIHLYVFVIVTQRTFVGASEPREMRSELVQIPLRCLQSKTPTPPMIKTRHSRLRSSYFSLNVTLTCRPHMSSNISFMLRTNLVGEKLQAACTMRSCSLCIPQTPTAFCMTGSSVRSRQPNNNGHKRCICASRRCDKHDQNEFRTFSSILSQADARKHYETFTEETLESDRTHLCMIVPLTIHPRSCRDDIFSICRCIHVDSI